MKRIVCLMLVLVLVGSAVMPAMAAHNRSINVCPVCSGAKIEKVFEDSSVVIYKIEDGGKTYLIRDIKTGKNSGKIQIAELPDDLGYLTNSINFKRIQPKVSWSDIVVRYEVFLDEIGDCNVYSGKKHHYAGVTFELTERAGSYSEIVLSAILCTLIGKNPYVGLVCSIAVGILLYEYPHEKIYTIGSWDYDIWRVPMHADGVGLGWHTPVNNMIPVSIFPRHPLTW